MGTLQRSLTQYCKCEGFTARETRILTVRASGAKTGRVDTLLNRLHASLNARQLPCGGWSFFRGSVEMSLEPTCLALLALRLERCANTQVLLEAQRPDGSWGSFASDD